MRDLGQLLTDWHGDAAVLHRRGQHALAEQLEQCATEAAQAAEEWLVFLSETDAMLRSGRTRDWLRARFAEWERDGHARVSGKERQYRVAVIPRRYSVIAASEAGREAARAARGRQP